MPLQGANPTPSFGGFGFSDTEGKEALRVSFFDLNKPHDIRPYQKGEGLPEDYWEPTK